jgi:hypothetical protein
MIGPVALLLVVCHVVPVLVLCVGLEKSTKLGCEIFSQGHILSTSKYAIRMANFLSFIFATRRNCILQVVMMFKDWELMSILREIFQFVQ